MTISTNNSPLEKIEKVLRNNGCRITKQKHCIIKEIIKNPNSSCKEIFHIVNKGSNVISHTTVYRVVKQLEEYGFIKNRGIAISMV